MAKSNDNKKKDKKDENKKKPSRPLTEVEIFDNLTSDVVAAVTLIERHVTTNERKFALRALRRNSLLRRRVTKALFHRLLPLYYPQEQQDFVKLLLQMIDSVTDEEQEEFLSRMKKDEKQMADNLTASSMRVDISDLDDDEDDEDKAVAMATDDNEEEEAAPKAKELTGQRDSILVEVDMYWRILITLFLLDHKKIDDARTVIKDALTVVRHSDHHRRRTLEPVSWRVERYAALADELSGDAASNSRPALLAALRRAALRHDAEGTATLLCIALRGYVLDRQSSQAFKLLSRTPLQTESVSAAQLARLLYYQGRIKAVQLEYSAAFANLSQAARKAPRTGARGFRLAVAKASVVVQLLMGDVPERSTFTTALEAYLALARAVRVGDVLAFESALKQHTDAYKRDRLLTLVERLRHNVLKAGLRKISVSYSRISLADIAKRLRLQSAEDAESVVAKAIRDGVIDATIDHAEGFVRSAAQEDVYSTYGPTQAFHTRVEFCLKVRDEAVQAMRYPDKMSQLEAERKERERTLREERELAASIEDDDEDDE